MGGHYKHVVSVQPKSEFTIPSNPAEDTLENVTQIVIKQHLSMIEAITDFDRINRYYIWNGATGEQLFNAREGNIGCCQRNCWQGNREFDMPFLNRDGKEAFQLNKTRSCSALGCCMGYCCAVCCKGFGTTCCGFDDDYSNLSVTRNGTKDYYIAQHPHFSGYPDFSVKNTFNGNTEFTVTMDSCCFSAYNCTDVVYDVVGSTGAPTATIAKYWAGGKTGFVGCCVEAQNASTWVIDINQPLNVKQKTALIGAAMLLDYTYYQIKKDNN